MTRHRIALQGSRLLPGQSLADPVDSSEGWRSACDVVVIGGGIVGVCTALYLADQGVDVVLIEKGVIAGEASGRAVGFIDSAMMAREKQEAIRVSKTLWGALDRRCGGRTGYRQSGLVFAMDRTRDLLAAADWARQTTVEARILTRSEAVQLMPRCRKRAVRGRAVSSHRRLCRPAPCRTRHRRSGKRRRSASVPGRRGPAHPDRGPPHDRRRN